MAHTTDRIAKENKYLSVAISPEELVQRKQGDKPVWEIVLEIMKDIPEEEINKLPADGSEEHDHYIYGTPKKNA